MCADFKSERSGTENISQCSQSERSCTENLFRENFAGVVYREHMNGPYFPLIFKLTFTTKTPLYTPYHQMLEVANTFQMMHLNMHGLDN